MEEIRVSVVIPVYNVEAYLTDCLNSVTGQTLREIELLCVDDCSTDRCREILSAAAEQDPRIRLFFGDVNRGQGHCRNVGIEIVMRIASEVSYQNLLGLNVLTIRI